MLKALGLAALPADDKEKTIAAIYKHLTKVVVETILANLGDAEIKEFLKTIGETSGSFNVKTEKFVGKVPGLSEKIEQAVAEELALILSAADMGGK